MLSLPVVAIILGVVEGLTEFLPISSTGHLILFDRVLQFQSMLASADKAEVFEVVIQLGAIVAIGAIYRRELFASVGGLLQDLRSATLRPASIRNANGRLGLNIAIAFLPAAIFGFLFHKLITHYLFSPLTVGLTLVLGGFAIIFIERQTREEDRTITLQTMSTSDALVVGFAQVLSLIPGTSRSAATIMGGLLRGIRRSSATEFSFLLAFPVMIAASGFDLVKHLDVLTRDMLGLIAIGFVTSFVVAWVVVAWFIRFVQGHTFTGFGLYRILLGFVVLILWGMGYFS